MADRFYVLIVTRLVTCRSVVFIRKVYEQLPDCLRTVKPLTNSTHERNHLVNLTTSWLPYVSFQFTGEKRQLIFFLHLSVYSRLLPCLRRTDKTLSVMMEPQSCCFLSGHFRICVAINSLKFHSQINVCTNQLVGVIESVSDSHNSVVGLLGRYLSVPS
ncbi:hypothetical protein CRM22_005034 [Opisthorchis felineus]|uniref:Uncharacterized protein n=1 Tax=Opisthorchis felineus TaxID=147828 RepID=A0A4S2LZP4_OPIFE|nr:hypothetical protein CRM22_005034 [Opisthorchis felineus]